MKKLSTFMAAALAFGAGSLIATQDVFADASSTEGSLRGQVRDKGASEPAVGATVVATSPALQGEQVVITDDTGQYFITALPPGVYTLTVYYNDVTYSRGNVLVQVGKEVVINISVNTADATGKPKGEVINIQGAAPIIDQGSTKTGVTIGDDYTRNIPVGRTFGEVIGASAGAAGDTYGTGFSGATSVENTYVVEGINTTDSAFGLLSSNLPNEFVSETEVITGGYAAEYGRATGGLINVATKQGSNEFHGSVFGNYAPSALVAGAKIVDSANAIDYQTNPGTAYDIGAEVGGPIIKDKLWFHVGFDPSVTNTNTKRFIGYETDDGTGNPVLSNGQPVKTNITSQNISTQEKTYFFTGKINGAIDQNNQFQISAFGNPENGTSPLNPALLSPEQDSLLNTKLGAWDVAAKWTSKLNQGKTQIDAIVGFHRQWSDNTPNQPLSSEPTVEYAYTRSLADFADLEGSNVASACQDSAASNFIKCPVTNYQESGLGVVEDRTNDRLTAALTVTQRVKLGGYHTFKAGVDYEGSSYDSRKYFTGGEFLESFGPGSAPNGGAEWLREVYLHNVQDLSMAQQMNPQGVALGATQQLCLNNQAICEPGVQNANTGDRSIGAFIQDSWQILPNLTLNLGVRYENQGVGIASDLQNTVASDGEHVGTEGINLNNWAPRLGFIWDPTNEGKAKIYGHYGRFYENIPMDINVRSFGGEIDGIDILNSSGLQPGQTGYDPNCAVDHTPTGPNMVGATINKCTDVFHLETLGGNEYVAPGLQGQYSNEFILGAEYEVLPDIKVGINYIHRDLPTIIEDTLVNGGNYYIVNPGDNFDSQAASLAKTAAAELTSNNPATVAQGELDQARSQNLTQIKNLDTPTRNYDAVQLQVTQRPTKDSLILASYTYSREYGNYPGLFSTETGQLDPNITSEYDLEALLPNRYGPTGLDRPHDLKIDGFYRFDFKVGGLLTLGASIRAQSGIAHNVLGNDPYGQGETYILPRGVEPRSPLSNEEDIHVSYGYRLTKTVELQVFMDIFNLFNQQQEATEDENYTFNDVHPIVGGDMTDLQHLKQLNSNGSGTAINATPTLNPDFLKTTSYLQNPRTFRFGFRLTF
jgi:TonB dependent receptor/Carboxypeptidase regulatory-like domain